jgi:hypothetical protein
MRAIDNDEMRNLLAIFDLMYQMYLHFMLFFRTVLCTMKLHFMVLLYKAL